jgi:ATPase subunit of ABC transporter with duplicated ATPase domains
MALQADALDLEASVQETLERAAGTDVLLSDIKALLGRMLFTGKSVHKKVRIPGFCPYHSPV